MWICPNCKKESTEDNLYCDQCGYEVQIVPDFEPELEASLLASLSNLIEHIEVSKPPEEIIEEDPQEQPIRKRKNTCRNILLVLAFTCVIILIIGISYYRDNSYDYQLNQGIKMGEAEKYEKGVPYLERAISIDGRDPNTIILLADFYNKCGNNEIASLLLEESILGGKGTEAVYKKLISIYEKEEDYEKIGLLLENCTDKIILTTFQTFAALKPEFNLSEGTYFKIMSLKLTGNTTGIIYYTLDGTEPTIYSDIYTTPIFLEEGNYEVKALFVNEYGIHSDIETYHYFIDVTKPYAPEISLFSDVYEQAKTIEVEVQENCKVYYTMDGTIPTINSTPYTLPISLPFGDSEYIFITYSDLGAASETTRRTYNLTIQAEIEPAKAEIIVLEHLIEQNIIIREYGEVEGAAGRNIYFCSTAFVYENQTYYLISEYYEDGVGTRFKTENLYSVHISSGEVGIVSKNKIGYYETTPYVTELKEAKVNETNQTEAN